MASEGSIPFPDGSAIPIEWVYPDGPDYEWMREREHWPDPMTPFERWVFLHGNAGADRAWREIGLEAPPAFARFQLVGPYLYVRVTPPSPEQLAKMAPAYMKVSQERGGAFRFWREYCEPRIKQACDELAATDPGADLRAVAETLFYGFHQTFTCLAMLYIPGLRLNGLLSEAGIEDAEMIALELTQGDENATQDIDEEIYRLAELARSSGAVTGILAEPGDALDALRAEPKAAAFVEAFDGLIERHGRRSQGWMMSIETWAERPEAALALVRAQVASERVSPDEWRARTAQRREEAQKRTLAALPESKHAEFREIMSGLEGLVNIREGRAYWQLVIAGETRGVALRIGEDLVRRGLLDAREDALFLTPDDLQGEGPRDLRAVAAREREAWERWRAADPPSIIGTPGDTSAGEESRRAEFKGMPASRGVATGVARVLANPEEGSRLQRGEILVCVMTTPAWTPLFAIAGGIVTETGGALSHPAITAREYGIPAVVALPEATARIADGQTITIDGGAGTVHAG